MSTIAPDADPDSEPEVVDAVELSNPSQSSSQVANSRIDELRRAVGDVIEGRNARKFKVRELLACFGCKRRGAWVVEWVRKNLRDLGVRTDPDFNTVWIDAEVSLVPIGQGVSANKQNAVSDLNQGGTAFTDGAETTTAAGTVVASTLDFIKGAVEDPTYRVGQLEAANKGVVSVAPNDPLKEAITLMLLHGFSQLPVMQSEREVKGVVTWESIGARLALGCQHIEVRDFMAPAQIIASDRSFFNAMETIARHQYVLVRQPDNKISGIVTASDLTLQFQQLTEPFLLLGEIEQHIRRLVAGKFTAPELEAFRDPSDESRKIEEVADLTVGEYVRIFQDRECWEKLKLGVDRAMFVEKLDAVRVIRNDVMHFDPDPLDSDDLTVLRQFVVFMQSLREIGAC